MTLEKLRSVVRDCLGKHLYSSGIFFADKLVTMSDSAPADVFLLSQAYYLGKHYRRALHLLRQEHLLAADARFRYLAAKCLEEVKEWDECLALLGDGEFDEDGNADVIEMDSAEGEMLDMPGDGREINIAAAICLLRGRAYEALENRTRAALWYKASLKADPYCYEVCT
ncbi:hypothetical protein CBR_g50375 [Chara braunii]|uniref:Anaphase-promoting complex subunit 6 n=1 Tax=Chara braunii TaxID=69332 RepID=A0A388M6H8_CHABU|nr:hypothetical protein CBR_g50375 [Chara braunii]|eukprot:GBG90194.1 hypothetical protein CBR_g50375 [Chara braunii]